jgi:glycosyltransferase involved in cell wall biosynthesis
MPSPLVCAFGYFDSEGDRFWVIRDGMQSHGFSFCLCKTEAKGFLRKYKDLLRQWNALTRRPDILLLPFVGQYVAPLAWLLARRRRIPLVLDALISVYDTDVFDRKKVARWHPKAAFLWFADWLSCRLADAVVVDTPEHARYFMDEFGAREDKILVIPVGARTDIYGTVPPVDEAAAAHPFTVLFYGTFIPLHGIETILGAAKVLQEHNEPVRFEFYGKGQTHPAMTALAKRLGLRNVSFHDPVPPAALASVLRNADVCLGIFGTTPKALRVFPTKAYEILACGRPLITARTAASERIVTDNVNTLLVPPGDSAALAEAILRLENEPALRETLAQNGQALFHERFQPGTIVSPLVRWLRSRLPA